MYAAKYLFLILLLLAIIPSQAAPTVETYGSLPSTSLMTLSPNGDKMAFRKVEGKKDVLVVYSLEQNKVIQILDISSVNPQYLYFISDTQLIVRIGQQKKLYGFKGDSHYLSAAYVLDLGKGSVDQLLVAG